MISVVMPVYNVQDYINDAVDSVLKQTFTKFELIIINDGSTDKTLSKLEKYTDPRIKIYTTQNRGLSAARNLGMKLATGEYIYFMDSDDVIANNLFDICIDLFKENSIEMICFNFDRVTSVNLNSIAQAKIDKKELLSSEEALYQLMNEDIYQMAWSYVCEKKLFDENNILYPEGRLFEDNNTAAKLLSNASKILKLSLQPYGYFSRKRRGSITDVASKKHSFKEFQDYRFIYEDEYQVFLNKFGENDPKVEYWYFKELVLLYIYYKYPTINEHKDSMLSVSKQLREKYKARNFKIDFKLWLQYLRVNHFVFDEVIRNLKKLKK